jgi:hypothetical protein
VRTDFGVEIEILGFLELTAHFGEFVDDAVQGFCVAARRVVARRQRFSLQQRRVAQVEYQVEARLGQQRDGGRLEFVFRFRETQPVATQAAGKSRFPATHDSQALDRCRGRPGICGTKQRCNQPLADPACRGQGIRFVADDQHTAM